MPNPRRIFLKLAVLFLPALVLPASSHAQTTGMVQFFAGGKLQKGMPLVDLAQEMVVIGRDGWMHSLNPSNPKAQIRRLDERYQPASVTELRNQLRAEFGGYYEVVSTKHFLVVQPRNRGDRWPKLFEQSHRSFIDYMGKRGVTIRRGRFPMVAIVFPDEGVMYREFKKMKIDVSRVAGLYSLDSNRVMTHDGGRYNAIAATVRHEAAHQSAFNSGVHSRVNDMPRWITEGIGQMFEPAAMTNARAAASLSDRINLESVGFIKSKYKNRNDLNFSRAVRQLVGDDTMFENRSQVTEAYSIAWAVMFYLAERRPKAFAALLNHTARRPPFQEYNRGERLHDFERIVESDTFEFSKRLSWWLQSL